MHSGNRYTCGLKLARNSYVDLYSYRDTNIANAQLLHCRCDDLPIPMRCHHRKCFVHFVVDLRTGTSTCTLCIFCNPSCITDSSVVKASKNTKLRSHPTSSFSIRPFCNRNFGCKARHSCTGSCIFAGPFATGNTFCNLVERVRPLQRVKARQKTSQCRPQPWPSPGVSVRAPSKRFQWQTLTARSIGVVAVYLSVLAS